MTSPRPLLLLFLTLTGCELINDPLGRRTCGALDGHLVSYPDLNPGRCMERCGANWDTVITRLDEQTAWIALTPYCTSPTDQEALDAVAMELEIPWEELTSGSPLWPQGWLTDPEANVSAPIQDGSTLQVLLVEERQGQGYMQVQWDLAWGETDQSLWMTARGMDWMRVEDAAPLPRL